MTRNLSSMSARSVSMCLALLLAVTALSGLSYAAQDNDNAVPRFTIMPPKPALPGHENPGTSLQVWNGSFTFNGNQYNYVMVGADPATNQGALIPVWIIPTKIVLSDGSTWDPLAGGPTSPLARTVISPLFDSTTTYTQGGVNVGTTQYIDAYARASFWSIVQNNPNYHIKLGGPTAHISVLPTLTLNVPSGSGAQCNHFGITVACVSINYMDVQINNYMAQNNIINPSGFPIFLTANTYLTQGGCCIGGYHSATGGQTYSHATYITTPGVFSADVSALSHELGEWQMDPLWPHQNNSPCGIMENGDPLVRTEGSGHDYGQFPYVLHGFTYHLQDLVTLKYFGGDPNEPVNGFFTFQGWSGVTTTCQFGS